MCKIEGLNTMQWFQEIDMSSFADCKLLERIIINPKLQIIALLAFNGCAGTTELIIPQGLLKVI
jgi:hypothetical protein